VTIVVEWENVELAGAEQANRMLDTLVDEVAAYPAPVEVLLCVAGEAAELEGAELPTLPSEWRIVPVGEAHYFEIKNRGAALAEGAIVVFLDSDAVPERGWLAAMLRPFDDPRVEVVAGHTSIAPTSLVAKAFALWWFFPLRDERPAASTPLRGFFANNVAFRRDTILGHPFVSPDGTVRGACVMLARRLDQAGIPIVSAPDAAATHPPPNGWRHIVLRGVVQGRDRMLREPPVNRRLGPACGRFARYVARSWWRSLSRGDRVGLSLVERPVAALLGCVYYGCAFVGELAAWRRWTWAAELRV
jgi:hypothetical protein